RPNIRMASSKLVLPLSFGPMRTVNGPRSTVTSRRHLKFVSRMRSIIGRSRFGGCVHCTTAHPLCAAALPVQTNAWTAKTKKVVAPAVTRPPTLGRPDDPGTVPSVAQRAGRGRFHCLLVFADGPLKETLAADA